MHVAMIGPDLDAQGGISTVARTWLGTDAMAQHRIDYLGSVNTSSKPRKAMIVATRQARFVARLASGWRPDLFHIHASYFISFYRKLAWFQEAAATGRPVIVHLHAPDLASFHDASRVHAAAMQWMLNRADRVVALSEHMRDQILGWTQARVEVIHNPADLQRFACPERTATRPPTVLFMGAIGDRKGAFDLLRAIPEILRKVPAARFRFGGDGEVERLRQEAEQLGISEQVELLGWLRGSDVVQAFADADIFCLPSYHEGLPMSILEAMAAGLPVVSTPIAGIPEAVEHGSTGLLVQPGAIHELGEALAELLADPARRQQMGRAARTRAEQRFDAEALAGQVIDLWSRVLQERKNP